MSTLDESFSGVLLLLLLVVVFFFFAEDVGAAAAGAGSGVATFLLLFPSPGVKRLNTSDFSSFFCFGEGVAATVLTTGVILLSSSASFLLFFLTGVVVFVADFFPSSCDFSSTDFVETLLSSAAGATVTTRESELFCLFGEVNRNCAAEPTTLPATLPSEPKRPLPLEGAFALISASFSTFSSSFFPFSSDFRGCFFGVGESSGAINFTLILLLLFFLLLSTLVFASLSFFTFFCSAAARFARTSFSAFSNAEPITGFGFATTFDPKLGASIVVVVVVVVTFSSPLPSSSIFSSFSFVRCFVFSSLSRGNFSSSSFLALFSLALTAAMTTSATSPISFFSRATEFVLER